MAVVETTWISARIPLDLAKALAEIAKANERSSSAELRLALKAHVETETKAAA